MSLSAFTNPPTLPFLTPSISRTCRSRPLTMAHSPSVRPPPPTLQTNKKPLATKQIREKQAREKIEVSESPTEIVLTHATADFDSLAAAVGLARLRSPNCKVVIPAGTHAAVGRYLSLHKQLLPLVDVKMVEGERLKWVGVADTSQMKRLGVGREWVREAEEVFVLDHHSGGGGVEREEVGGGKLEVVMEEVGAVSTAVVEMMMERAFVPSRAELTLLAIGIHTDTGSLSYENTTARDAKALAWVLEMGACQRSIGRFSRSYLNLGQQRLLANALDGMEVVARDGLAVATVVLETTEFVKGMAAVAQAALEVADIDVLLLAAVCEGKNGMKGVSLIGRAGGRADGVDFQQLFRMYGGGGHAKAGSANLKMVDLGQVESLVADLVERLLDALPPPVLACDFMSSDVRCVELRSTMEEVRRVLFESGHTGLAVVKEEGGELVGVVSRQDVAVAEKKGLLSTPVKGWVARKVISVEKDTPLHEIEAKLVDFRIGRLPVVEDGQVVGIITRSDVLLQRRLYSPC